MKRIRCSRAGVVPAACGGFVVRAVFPKHAGAWAEFYGVSGRGLPAGELEKRPLRPVETFPTEAEAKAFMDAFTLAEDTSRTLAWTTSRMTTGRDRPAGGSMTTCGACSAR